MKYISFSFYKSYYYFLLFWILELIITIIRNHLFKKSCKDNNNDVTKNMNELINIICYNLGDLLAGILVIYSNIVTKPIKKEEDELVEKKKSKIHLELIYNDLSIKKNKYLLIFIISVLELIARFNDLLFYLIIDKERIRDGEISWLISVDILSRVIFSRIILNVKLYKHHIVSLIINFIGNILMIAGAFDILTDEEIKSWPYFFFVFAAFIIFPLEHVLDKILLTNKFLLPHSLMFLRGAFNFFMIVIICPILIYTNDSFLNENYSPDIYQIINQIIMRLIIIVSSFFKSFFTLKVIFLLSPQHVSFLNVVFTLYELVVCRITHNDTFIIIISDCLAFIFIIFSILLFNEMIIINAFGLNENTKMAMLKKEKEEFIHRNSSFSFYDKNEENNEEDRVSIDKNNNKINAINSE